MGTYHEFLRFAQWLSSFPYNSSAIRLHEISWLKLKPYTYHHPVQNHILMMISLSGYGQVDFDGRHFTLQAGKAIIADCRKNIVISTQCPEWNIISVDMSGSLADSLYSYSIADDNLMTNASPDIVMMCENIYTETQSPFTDNQDIKISSMLYVLFGMRFSNVSINSRISGVVTYINNHYADKLDIDFLAGMAYMSKYHFIRTFQEQMGQTPHSYIQEVRIRSARSMLLCTRDSVSNIAEKVGYTDHSYFSEQFKKHTGYLPREFRKEFSIR